MRYSKSGYWGMTAAGILLCIGGTILALYLPPAGPSAAKAIIISVAALAGMLVVLLSYRNADEVILATHKTAWFWGSMTALTTITPLEVAVLWNLIDVPMLLPLSGRRPGDYFIEGVLVLLALQAAGFAAFWAYYNLARRG